MKTIIKNDPVPEVSSTIHDVIILDKSGSMSSIAKQAVEGVNETLAAIRRTSRRNKRQSHLVTLVAFCGCGLTVLYDAVPIAEVRNLSGRDYRPCCMTPLYDAVGTTVTRLSNLIGDDACALASVTIITDGYENASKEYSGSDVKRLIEQHKEKGWMFAYIGAEHDVESVAFSLAIDNTLRFRRTAGSTRQMFNTFAEASADWADDVDNIIEDCCACCASPREMQERVSRRSSSFFKKEK